MYQWTEICLLALTKQKSKRAISREYDLHWNTLQEILDQEEPPGYRERRPRMKPKLDRFLPIIITEGRAIPADIAATVYRHLEIDLAAQWTDLQGRPHPIVADGGRPIAGLS